MEETQGPDQQKYQLKQGRTARMVATAIIASILPLAIAGGFFFLLNRCLKFDQTTLSPMIIVISIIVITVALASVINTSIGLVIANDNIFPFSGRPIEMAHSLYQSFFLQSQTLLAVLLIGLVSLLLVTKIITASEGLPVITGAAGFALGKDFRGRNVIKE